MDRGIRVAAKVVPEEFGDVVSFFFVDYHNKDHFKSLQSCEREEKKNINRENALSNREL